MLAQGLHSRQANERLLDLVFFPKLFRRLNPAIFFDDQDKFELYQFLGTDAEAAFLFDQRHRQIKFFILKQALEFGMVALTQPNL